MLSNSKLCLVLAAITSVSGAHAQSAASVCGSVLMSSDKTRCLQLVAGHQVEPQAAAVCGTVMMSSDKITCLQGTLDKHYSPDELSACQSVMMGGDKASCMAAAGQAAGPKRAAAKTARPGDESDDEDDRPRPARRNAQPMISIRLTNYHRATLARLFWKRVGERRYGENQLDAQLKTNRFQDLSLPDEVLTVCIETRDGFRLWWQKLDVGDLRDGALNISANERNWTQGRCEDG